MINRRDLMLGASTASCAIALPSRVAAAFQPPNILHIITDEQSSDATSYRIGTRHLHSPNTDGVAWRGRIYTRAYCSNLLCVPSPTSMFTGRYPTVTGVMDNAGLTMAKLDFKRGSMLSKIFADPSYERAYFGKWHIPCIGLAKLSITHKLVRV